MGDTMGDDMYARQSIVWRNLINAVALEAGLLPTMPQHDVWEDVDVKSMLKQLPEDERRELTRKFRKVRRRMTKQAKDNVHRVRMRLYTRFVNNVIIDMIEEVCVRVFPQVAAQFTDTRAASKCKFMHGSMDAIFREPTMKRLMQRFQKAAEKLAGGNHDD